MGKNNFVITISSGFGAGGAEVSAKLAKDLGIYYYNHRIHQLAAEISNLSENEIEANDEHLQGGYLLSKIKTLPTIFTAAPSKDFTENGKIYQIQSKIITDLADSDESCIIVGKCAGHILREYDNVLSVFIDAPRLTCLHNVTYGLGVTAPEANRLITETDKYRTDYYKFYTDGGQWREPQNYDLILNTGRLSEDKCVEIIKYSMQQKFGADIFDHIQRIEHPDMTL